MKERVTMITRRNLMCIAPVLMTSACQAMAQPGPGMILTYLGLRNGLRAQILNITLPSGTHWGSPGGIGGRRPQNWRNSGKTEGASGDNRELPEWLEFEWFDTVYQRNPPYTKAELDAIPRQSQRVPVRARVPQDVVQAAIEARQQSPANKVPETLLWLYFVWTDAGIKFHWELNLRSTILRSGGDDIDAM